MKKMTQEEIKQMQADRREETKKAEGGNFLEALVFVLIVGVLSIGAFYGATNCEMNCEVNK